MNHILMEETGENWPSESDSEKEGNKFYFDEEEKSELLEERFLALSATIPGLKNKMDDTLILDKASKYVKQLQQRVRELEQQVVDESNTYYYDNNNDNNNNKCCNKLLLGSTSSCDEEVRSHHYHHYNYGQEQDHHNTENNTNNLPEIKVKFMQKQVLVIVHCERQKGIMIKILSELENLHLSVLNNSVLPFGNSTLEITIIAQMGDGYKMTMDELVKSLRLAIMTH